MNLPGGLQHRQDQGDGRDGNEQVLRQARDGTVGLVAIVAAYDHLDLGGQESALHLSHAPRSAAVSGTALIPVRFATARVAAAISGSPWCANRGSNA
jgi:hypothetical protein